MLRNVDNLRDKGKVVMGLVANKLFRGQLGKKSIALISVYKYLVRDMVLYTRSFNIKYDYFRGYINYITSL